MSESKQEKTIKLAGISPAHESYNSHLENITEPYQDSYAETYGDERKIPATFSASDLVEYSSWRDFEVGFIGDTFDSEKDSIKIVFMDSLNKAKDDLWKQYKKEIDALKRGTIPECVIQEHQLKSRTARRAFKKVASKHQTAVQRKEVKNTVEFIKKQHQKLFSGESKAFFSGYLKKKTKTGWGEPRSESRYVGYCFVLCNQNEMPENYFDEEEIEVIKTHFGLWRMIQPEGVGVSTFVIGQGVPIGDAEIMEVPVKEVA